MRTNKPRSLAGLGIVVATCASALAGSATYDFNSAPPADLNFVVSQADAGWRDTGGVDNSGYMALFDSVNGQTAAVLIPDFDQGLIVKAFTFECDLRIGNAVGNGGRPADGFSISYARADDPVVADLAQEPPVYNGNNFSLGGAPENGTKTGLAISFDTWSGNTQPDGGADLEGIMINLDGKVVLVNGARGIPMPNRNGSCTDATSMQTGPWDDTNPGSPDGLCWAHFKAEVDETGAVTVTWKGTVIADKIPTGFSPSAGRIVFAGRTGGANENTHIDNLKITTIPSDKALYTGGSATAVGYTLQCSDSGASQVNESTITVMIDDVAVTPTSVTKNGPLTTISVVTAPNWLASGSTHKTEVHFTDTQGVANLGGIKDVVVSAYADLTPDMAVTGVSTSAGNRGFLLRTWYVANEDGTAMGDLANNNDRTEQELFGELGRNQIDNPDDLTQVIPGTANKYFKEPEYLNHDEAGASQGMFSDLAADPQRQATEKQIPGIFGALNNLACEALFFAQFTTAGLHTFGCNSDDGFRLYAGKNPLDRYQVDGKILGQFSGGRGTDANGPQTLFQVLVREPGIYLLRFTWEEGGGGSNFELYQQLADGSLALFNDTARAASVVKTYWDGPRTSRAYISKVTVPAAFDGAVEIAIMDGGTSVVDGSVKLQVGGADVTPTVTKSGATTTVRYAPVNRQWITGNNSVRLMYDESGGGKRDQAITFPFFPNATALPANSFSIEAEHFDNNGVAQISNGTGYTGDEYAGLAATHLVDYYQDGNTPDQDGAYRATFAAGLNPHVPMDAQTAAAPDLDLGRPGFEVTTNYKIGWAGGGEWYNYKRTIPAGIYTAYAAHSIDPAATAGGDVGLVTAGAGTQNQTVQTLATIRGTPPGGWGNNGLLPAQDPSGGKGVFKLPGGSVTIRYTTRGGDFDWFTLVPTTSPAKLVRAPDWRDTSRRDASWYIQNFSTSVQNGSVKLFLDGVETPTTVTYTADGAEVKITDATAGMYSYKLTWSDGSAQEFSSTINIGPLPAVGAFVIEAEDFNTGGGQSNPKAGTAGLDVNVMPYLGGAYDGLAATVNVDYGSNDGNDSDVYRKGETPNKNINENLGGRWGKDRGSFDVTTNFKLGWTDTADWGNYTRTIPTGNYEVWAALSIDSRSADASRGSLAMVDEPASATQTVTPLGIFKGLGTGGWGANNLFPLTDDNGAKKVIALGGTKTLRFTADSGDVDWFVLVPGEGSTAPVISGITKNANGTITIEWTGGGTLQASPTISPAAWQDVTGATSPYTFTPTAAMLFGRVRQ